MMVGKSTITREKRKRLRTRRAADALKPNNIDENGNVLFLDEGRLRRKEQPEKPLYKCHPKGLGISDFLISHVTAARSWTWKFVLQEFKLIVTGAETFLNKDTFMGSLYSRITRFERDKYAYTHGTTLPLDVDVSEEGETTVLPIDLVKDVIANAGYIASMNTCICRDAYNCSDYPKDVCCLVFSKMARVLVKNGCAYEITREQAYERVDKAVELGLCAQAMFVELEQLIWGLKNEEMDGFFEICFCCPCCCVAQRVSRYGNERVKSRFNPSGWTAVAEQSKCIGCGVCASVCPQNGIRIADGKIQINQEVCTGCGNCKHNCPNEVIKIKQTMPMRGSIEEYFEKEGRLKLDFYGDGIKK